MMFIYKITEVNFLMSFRKYHDVTIAINDAAPYTGSKINCLNMVATRAPKLETFGAQNKIW